MEVQVSNFGKNIKNRIKYWLTSVLPYIVLIGAEITLVIFVISKL